MDPTRNPFVPGAGAAPLELTGREDQLERARIALERLRNGLFAKSFIAVGLRGVGKTVLLNRVRQIATDLDYRVIDIEVPGGKPLPALLVPQVRKMILELDRLGAVDTTVKRALRALKGFALTFRYSGVEIEMGIDPEAGLADSGDLEVDLPDLFVSLGRAAQARGRNLALMIDEFQYLSDRDMSALIMSLHKATQEKLPIIMFAAGLPQVVGQTGRSKSYSERLFDFPLVDRLSRSQTRRALEHPASLQGASFDTMAIESIFRQTDGYPFFVQLYGHHAWNASPGPEIGAQSVLDALPKIISELDDSFFRVRFDRLTPREKDYLSAMAQLGAGPHRSGEIADVLGMDVQATAPLRNGLIRKGMIYSPAHGDTAFTVPLFDQFLRRSMPGWSAPARSARPGRV